jgi:short-subunit dehydrogenase
MPIIIAKIREAISTNIELLCNSLYFGHDTLFLSSRYDSITNIFNFENIATFHFLHGWRDSNSQPMVLETTTLPIELHP